MQALHDIVKAGYVRYIGMSSCNAYQCTDHLLSSQAPNFSLHVLCSPRYAECVFIQLSEVTLLTLKCLDYAISHNLTPFIAVQNHYNVVYREEEREMMPTLNVISVFFTLLAIR